MQKVDIRLKGQIRDHPSGWFEGLVISHPNPAETVLTGIVSDQTILNPKSLEFYLLDICVNDY